MGEKKDGVRRDERGSETFVVKRETKTEREREREREKASTSGETDEENTCSGRVHAFQGFRESGGI